MESETATVLVADDEPHLLRLVKFRLEREGYDVLTAADGDAALQVARTEQPDLCVLDVMMPKRSRLRRAARAARRRAVQLDQGDHADRPCAGLATWMRGSPWAPTTT